MIKSIVMQYIHMYLMQNLVLLNHERIPCLTISKLAKKKKPFPVLKEVLNFDFSFYTGRWGDENCTVSLPCICKRNFAVKIEKEIPKDQNQHGTCPKGWLQFGFKVTHSFLLFDNSKCIPYLWQKFDFLRSIQYLKIFFFFESRALRFITTDSDAKVYTY